MASIITYDDGLRRIEFKKPNGKRGAVRMGRAAMQTCRTVQRHVEEILEAHGARRNLMQETADWLGTIEPKLHKRLVKEGLATARIGENVTNLGTFIEDYIAKRADVKPATKEIWGQGKRGLIDFFGADKHLDDISPGQADDYKSKLVAAKLAPMTIRKRLQFAKMIFRAAVRHRLIAADPFADVNIKATMSDKRRFITPEDTAKLIDSCPDQDWRSIVALARWGGLRCPSEVLSLAWNDIDWEHDRITVHSPKTEHHPGKATRTIPLFPELRDALWEAHEAAPDGSVYVVDERFRHRAMGPSGWRNCNLRTTFEKIVKRAGLTPWPRLFHNLRSSRQTELQEKFPTHVVCDWLGNSPDIAREHYLQVTSDHFARATKAQQKAQQQPTETVGNGGKSEGATCKTSDDFPLSPTVAYLKTDGEGFEPPVRFPVQQFSRLPP
jgi:integrase